MAFADPQTVTVSAVAQSLARVSSGESSGKFRKDDGTYSLEVNQTESKTRTRRQLRLNNFKIAADPLTPTANVKNTMSVYLMVDVPATGGYTVAETKAVIDGFIAYMSASSGIAITKLLGGEI